MKYIFTLIVTIFLGASTLMAQSQKTFVKSMALQGHAIDIDIASTVDVQTWDKDFVRLTVTIDVVNFSEDILKRLFSVGRYELQSTVKDGKMVIAMPKLETTVTIRGQELKEIVNLQVTVPQGVSVDMPENISAVEVN